MKAPRELKVKPIKNGTVIDHINANKALKVLKILGLPSPGISVTLAMNVQSSQMGNKDIVKIEGRELASREVDEIALIAPRQQSTLFGNMKSPGKAKLTYLTKSAVFWSVPIPTV